MRDFARPPVDGRSWMAWLRTPATIFLVFGAIAALVATFEYRDQQRVHRDTQQMYRGLADGLGAVADLQYEIQEARRSMLYALTTADATCRSVNRQVTRRRRPRHGGDPPPRRVRRHDRPPPGQRAGTMGQLPARPQQVIASILRGHGAEAVARDLSEGGPAFARVRARSTSERRQRRGAEDKLATIFSLSTARCSASSACCA
jgi:hypothetical protein